MVRVSRRKQQEAIEVEAWKKVLVERELRVGRQLEIAGSWKGVQVERELWGDIMAKKHVLSLHHYVI